MPPPGSHHLPEPAELHTRISVEHGPVIWRDALPSAAKMVMVHGSAATAEALQLLDRVLATEPRVTDEFLSAIPPYCAPYHLESRIKSPESLARKLMDSMDKGRPSRPEDILRYTVLTPHPDALVAATRRTVDKLGDSGWRVKYAMHSYTDGSRYKGIHAYLVTPTDDRVEVQIHSPQSAWVKEETRPWYEIERSAHASPDQRTEARRECIRLSAALEAPLGIDDLTSLGGRPVAVKNYSDSRIRQQPSSQAGAGSSSERPAGQAPTITRNGGISR